MDVEQNLDERMCGAKNRQGTPCRNWKLANGRCRFHGGKSLRGPASPRFKTGARSKALVAAIPANLKESFLAALADPDLLSLRSYVAMADAKVVDAVERYA